MDGLRLNVEDDDLCKGLDLIELFKNSGHRPYQEITAALTCSHFGSEPASRSLASAVDVPQSKVRSTFWNAMAKLVLTRMSKTLRSISARERHQ